MVGCAIDEMSANGPAFPTSPGLKVMSEPYIALMLGSGEPAAAAVRLGDVARHAPNMYYLHSASRAYPRPKRKCFVSRSCPILIFRLCRCIFNCIFFYYNWDRLDY